MSQKKEKTQEYNDLPSTAFEAKNHWACKPIIPEEIASKLSVPLRKWQITILRESKELIEEDSDMNDLFFLVRSNKPLTRAYFLQQFPKAKALLLSLEQLMSIEYMVDKDEESMGNRFCYVSAAGDIITIDSKEMKADSFIIFLKDLGD